jgi:glycosyltransferase involved in cell wall biosynthesis
MKVIVQIPCYNEEQTLLMVLSSIPKTIPGVDSLEVMVVDDGSTDKTVEVARKFGVQHIITRPRNVGLARQFHEAVNKALELGADIVVNTDGDNQYPQERIPDLIAPIMKGEADIVIADRQTDKIAHFSPLKKMLQRLGSHIVNKAAGTNLPDAASGFRAYSRKSLIRLNIITRFSYCMETTIQAGNKRLAIASVPVVTNPKTRESRLFKNMWQHVFKSASAIIRAYIMYKPYAVFVTLGGLLLVAGLIPFIRYVVLLTTNTQGDHIQSLLLGAILVTGAFLSFALGIISDLIRTNRILQEDALERLKELQFKK